MTTVFWLSDSVAYRNLITHRNEMPKQFMYCTADLELLWLLQDNGVQAQKFRGVW